jgi:hypothetical protein
MTASPTPHPTLNPEPDDWHVHLRDGAALQSVVAHTAAQFALRLGHAQPQAAHHQHGIGHGLPRAHHGRFAPRRGL